MDEMSDELMREKAAAYDCLAQIEAWQKKLQVITEKISKFANAEVKPKE